MEQKLLKAVENLLNALQDELALYVEVEKVEQEKSQLLRKGYLQDLSSINEKQENLIQKSIDLENIRLAFHKETTALLGIPSNTTVKQMIADIPSDFQDDFEVVHTNLVNTITSIKAINKLNDRLLNDALRWIDFSVSMIAGEEESGASYTKDGKHERRKHVKSLVFDKFA